MQSRAKSKVKHVSVDWVAVPVAAAVLKALAAPTAANAAGAVTVTPLRRDKQKTDLRMRGSGFDVTISVAQNMLTEKIASCIQGPVSAPRGATVNTTKLYTSSGNTKSGMTFNADNDLPIESS